MQLIVRNGQHVSRSLSSTNRLHEAVTVVGTWQARVGQEPSATILVTIGPGPSKWTRLPFELHLPLPPDPQAEH